MGVGKSGEFIYVPSIQHSCLWCLTTIPHKTLLCFCSAAPLSSLLSLSSTSRGFYSLFLHMNSMQHQAPDRTLPISSPHTLWFDLSCQQLFLQYCFPTSFVAYCGSIISKFPKLGYKTVIWKSKKGSESQNLNPVCFSILTTKRAVLPWKKISLLNLFLTNPCWSLFMSLLFPSSLQTIWLMICITIFLEIYIKLVCLWNFSVLLFFSWFRAKS